MAELYYGPGGAAYDGWLVDFMRNIDPFASILYRDKPWGPNLGNMSYRALSDLGLTDSQIDEWLSDPDNPAVQEYNYLWNTVRTTDFSKAVQELKDLLALRELYPEEVDIEALKAEAESEISKRNEELYGLYDTSIAELQALADAREADYRDAVQNIRAETREARRALLSSQHQQNAQLMDTLSSGMERSRRNALEAGASAGIRLADNINTLLSVQNKQSQTSLETSNQLAQMLMQQRASERSERNSYNDYMLTNKNSQGAYKDKIASLKHSYLTDVDNRLSSKREYADTVREQNMAKFNEAAAGNSFSSYAGSLFKATNKNPDLMSKYGKYGG